jgi:hypothetical protein
MALSKATKAWLDGVAEGSDHAALCACEVFAALESGDGKVSGACRDWLSREAIQRTYALVRVYAFDVIRELEALRSEK